MSRRGRARMTITPNRNTEEGVDTRITSPAFSQKKGKTIPEKRKVKKSDVITLIDQRMTRNRVIKYLLTTNVNQTMTTTLQEACITLIPQGPAQSQRIADTVWIERVEIRADVTLANSDIYGLARLGIYRWKDSTALSTPTPIDLFQTSTTNVVLSFFNFERKNLYHIHADEILNLSGTATNPTVFSQHWINRAIGFNSQMMQFDLGVNTATNHLFLYWASDSTVAPNPLFEYMVRVWYYDE